MHVKRPILLYCPDRDMLAATAFALRLHPYDVFAVQASKDALDLVKGKDAALVCSVVIHMQQGDPSGRLIHRMLSHGVSIPILLVDRAGDLAPVRYVDMVLYGRNTSMAHILSALETLCLSRRGADQGSEA
jgi:hypothetical protein